MIFRKAFALVTACIMLAGSAAVTGACGRKFDGPVFDSSSGAIGGVDSFAYIADDPGFYDIEIMYSKAGSEVETMSLYVGEHFLKKVGFPGAQAEDEEAVTETVFLDKGENIIEFKKNAGDGDINLCQFMIKRSCSTVSLIVAPHEDDEILAFAGVIQKTLAEGNKVRIVLLTNGDYFSSELGPVRIKESIDALSHLGVSRYDVILLGYGDASIAELYMADDRDQTVASRAGFTGTYGDPDLNMYDYHTLDTGGSGKYTGNNIRSDLYNIIYGTRPAEIYTTSELEWHPDHKYAYRLVRETVTDIVEDTDYHVSLNSSVIHGETADWPDRESEYFTDPFPSGGVTPAWDEAVHIELTEEMMQIKYDAISEYVSQNDGTEYNIGNGSFNYAFCKRDEFYYTGEF